MQSSLLLVLVSPIGALRYASSLRPSAVYPGSFRTVLPTLRLDFDDDGEEQSTSYDDDGSLLGGIISKSDNPYATSSAERLRARYGDDSLRSTREEREAVEDTLAADIARFKADKGIPASNYNADEELGLLERVISVLGTVLTYNFFIIIGFFAWFLAGVGLQFGANNYAVIGSFQALWEVLILPLLSTHMALTFLSAGLERFVKSS